MKKQLRNKNQFILIRGSICKGFEMIKKLICTTLLLICAEANAVNWIDLGKSNDKQVQIFLDLDTVRAYTKPIPLQYGNDDNVSGFIQFTYINSNPNRKQGWYYSKIFTIVNCTERSFATPSFITYGFKDEVISSNTDDYFTAEDFQVAFPETVGDDIVESICTAYDVLNNEDYS